MDSSLLPKSNLPMSLSSMNPSITNVSRSMKYGLPAYTENVEYGESP